MQRLLLLTLLSVPVSVPVPALAQLTVDRYSKSATKGARVTLKGMVRSSALVSYTDAAGRQFHEWTLLTPAAKGTLSGLLVTCGYKASPCATWEIVSVTAVRVYEALQGNRHGVVFRDWACTWEWGACEERTPIGRKPLVLGI